jgi:hypothetical protein
MRAGAIALVMVFMSGPAMADTVILFSAGSLYHVKPTELRIDYALAGKS